MQIIYQKQSMSVSTENKCQHFIQCNLTYCNQYHHSY